MSGWLSDELHTKTTIGAARTDIRVQDCNSNPQSSKVILVSPEQAEISESSEKCSTLPSAIPEVLETTISIYSCPPRLGQKYELLEQIGSGGMGVIWKIFDRSLNRTLAIKVLHHELAQDKLAAARFEHEAQIAVGLTHSNIGAVYGPGVAEDGRPYILMDFIEGESLGKILENMGKLDSERAKDIFQQIAEALSYSHSKGIIHRDIKPNNIIISKTPSGADLVHVVDFGLAKSLYEDVANVSGLTQTAEACGTPEYMSPEMFLGNEITPQADIYSLGCILFEMLTGSPPFTEKKIYPLVIQHLTKEPELSKIPDEFQSVVCSCLAKQAALRPISVTSVKEFEPVSDITDAPYSLAVRFITPQLPSLWLIGAMGTICSLAPNQAYIILLFLIGVVITLILNLDFVMSSSAIDSRSIRNFKNSLLTCVILLPVQFIVIQAMSHTACFLVSATSALILISTSSLTCKSAMSFGLVQKRLSTIKPVPSSLLIQCFTIFSKSAFAMVISAYSYQFVLSVVRWNYLQTNLLAAANILGEIVLVTCIYAVLNLLVASSHTGEQISKSFFSSALFCTFMFCLASAISWLLIGLK